MLSREHGHPHLGDRARLSKLFRVSVAGGWTVRAQILRLGPACVGTARHAVANYSADQDLDHDGVALAISEAVINVVMHAYRDREPGAVRIFASVAEGALVVVMSDDGLGMTPRNDSPGSRWGSPSSRN
jgi:hypothetical protein